MRYKKFIENNKALQLNMLQELVSIRSVKEKPAYTAKGEVYPFGQGVQKAFEYIIKKAEEMGFETKNVDNYGGHIDFGHGEETVGILGHLDVVPEGDGWSFDPYSGAVSDGYIYGRGTTDDKGPVIAALFAMKALKDSGYEPARKIRLILGLDEETGWEGMKYYFSKEKKPTFGFTPDAEFPAINGEKGIANIRIVKKFDKNQGTGLELSKLSGGSAVNMVAEKARAVIKASDTGRYNMIKSQIESYRTETGYRINYRGIGKSLEITSEGKAAHGATPEAGLSAISILMDFLGNLNFANDDVNGFVDFYNDYIGFDLNGERLGIGLEDAPSGKLTVNVGQIEYNKEAVTLNINLRYPVTCNIEQIYEKLVPLVDRYQMGLIKEMHRPPIFMDKDSPMIRALMESYMDNTGDREHQPVVIGGGTYARAADNIVAFGAAFPGDEDLMHQRNERLSLERLYLATEIYADALYKLTQSDFSISD